MFHNILVAIDDSPHAARALAEAVDLAQCANSRLTVLTSVPDPSAWLLGGGTYTGGIDLDRIARETEREYQSLLDDAVDTVPDNLPVTKVLLHGHPAERILEQIEKGRHDLVAMGSRGRGDVRSLLLGSVSHEVLHASRAAVLILHAEPRTGDGAPAR